MCVKEVQKLEQILTNEFLPEALLCQLVKLLMKTKLDKPTSTNYKAFKKNISASGLDATPLYFLSLIFGHSV